jgi:hypothetical protein
VSQSAIGRAALILTTNASGMRSGLATEGAHVRRWADDTARTVKGRMADVGTQAGKSAGAGMVSGLKGAAGPLAAASAVAASGLYVVKEAGDTLKELGEMGAVAEALGLTAEAFSGIAGVAKTTGEDTKEFIESLVTMGKLGREAASGTAAASAAFRDMGLNAEEFNKLKTDEQFFKVFDALSKMEDQSKRTGAAMAAFGDDGGKFLFKIAGKSETELRAMAKGFEVSTAEMNKAREASKAMGGAQLAVSKAWRGIAVGMAPAITLAATLVTRLGPVADWLGRGLSTYFTLWSGAFTALDANVSAAAAEVGRFGRDVLGMTGAVPTIQEVIVGSFRALGIAAAWSWDVIKFGAGAAAVSMGFFLEQGLAPALKAFRRLLDVATALPQATRPRWVGDLREAMQGVDESVGKIGAGMSAWGGAAAQGFGQSAGKFDGWLTNLLVNKPAEAAAKVGAAAGQAGADAFKKLDNAALTMGSSAEVSLRAKYELGGKGIADKQLAEQQKGNGFLAGILNGIRGIGSGGGSADLLPL